MIGTMRVAPNQAKTVTTVGLELSLSGTGVQKCWIKIKSVGAETTKKVNTNNCFVGTLKLQD